MRSNTDTYRREALSIAHFPDRSTRWLFQFRENELISVVKDYSSETEVEPMAQSMAEVLMERGMERGIAQGIERGGVGRHVTLRLRSLCLPTGKKSIALFDIFCQEKRSRHSSQT